MKKKLELLLERNKGNREFALAAEKEIRIGVQDSGQNKPLQRFFTEELESTWNKITGPVNVEESPQATVGWTLNTDHGSTLSFQNLL